MNPIPWPWRAEPRGKAGRARAAVAGRSVRRRKCLYVISEQCAQILERALIIADVNRWGFASGMILVTLYVDMCGKDTINHH